MSFKSQVSGFQRNFWIANIMEMFERLAFFSVRAVLPLWMVVTAVKNNNKPLLKSMTWHSTAATNCLKEPKNCSEVGIIMNFKTGSTASF